MKYLSSIALVLLLAFSACGEEHQAGKPAPQNLNREAIGYYCNMIVADHQGPKAQIFLKDRMDPIWFSSVRDGMAFTMLPEEPKNRSAFYVNDMGKADWSAPGDDSWIEAETAFFVIESAMRGGMGALEAVPFADQAAAEAFTGRHGGTVVTFKDIPESYVLTPDSGEAMGGDHQQMSQENSHGDSGHDMPQDENMTEMPSATNEEGASHGN
jgi:copper chaperone NosL